MYLRFNLSSCYESWFSCIYRTLDNLMSHEISRPVAFYIFPQVCLPSHPQPFCFCWIIHGLIFTNFSGALNLASRSLPCIPSALFEIHLGIKPEPLKLVPVEPPITTSSSDDPSAARRRADNHKGPSWYEAQDLEILKAWSNEIVEIQPEISMFGSLKTIDVRITPSVFCSMHFELITR